MRTLCANLDREDALETVLEVPVPEETFTSNNHNSSWQLTFKSWLIRPNLERPAAWRSMEIQSLLGVIGAPLIPLPISSINDHSIKGHPIERSMAKYIVQQYVAASGGEHALDAIQSMCAIGKVKMASSEFEGLSTKNRNMKQGQGQLGGFVLWQKKPDMWSLELMVSGHKLSAGSDGKVAWRQTPWQPSHSSRGPPRPLRRSLQGLDPQSTANLFSDSICMGEKTINGEDCFELKLETEESTLRARSSSKVEMIRHTVFGYFSQKTGLLVQLEDSQLLKINDVFWETNMESWIEDYRTIEGVNIAHGGRTNVSLLRFGQDLENNSRTRMEEVWSIEEVDFNVKGLSGDCFMVPADLIMIKNDDDEEECGVVAKKGGLRYKVLGNCGKICAPKSGAKVVAVDDDNLELFAIDE